jgi:phenylalanyl-tRNA synthetase beta chain
VASTTIDDHEGLQPPAPIELRTSRLNGLLGTSLEGADVAMYLEPIGFKVAPVSEGVQLVTPPTFRPDATLEVDLIEEVARHYGYANIPRTVPHSPQVGRLSEYQADRRLVRSILVGAGIDEAQTPSLLGPGDHERAGLVSSSPIAAADAMIVEESLLRTSLLPGLLRSLVFNAARRSPDVAFFEVGAVFSRPAPDRIVEGPDAALPDERERVSVALAGDAVAAKRVLDELIEGLRLVEVSLEAVSGVEGLHPARTATVRVSGTDVGVVGEVDPAVVAAWGLPGRVGWLDLDLRVLLAAPRKPMEQLPISKFPSSDVDLAFVLPEAVAAGAVEAALRAGAGELLQSVTLFDVYRGDQVPEGTRSLAYRLRFVSLEKTLTDADVAAARAAAITAAEAAGATLRS